MGHSWRPLWDTRRGHAGTWLVRAGTRLVQVCWVCDLIGCTRQRSRPVRGCGGSRAYRDRADLSDGDGQSLAHLLV